MVSTWFDLIRETLLEDSYPHPTAMIDTNTLQQLQNCIAEMERHHKEELRKLKVDHDQMETRVRHPQGDEHSAHTLLERTQGELHPRCIINTPDDLSLYHMHCLAGWTTRRHPSVNHIVEEDIPMGWKPLNLE